MKKWGGYGPRATPTIAGDKVFALGATGFWIVWSWRNGRLGLVARTRWAENHASNLVFGKSSSPLVLGNLVIISGGQTNGPTLLAYQRDTTGRRSGKPETDEASYSSADGRDTLRPVREVLSLNATSLTAHDAADGHIEWQYSWKVWGPRLRATADARRRSRAVCRRASGLAAWLLQVKADSSGKLSATEVWKNLRLKAQFSSVGGPRRLRVWAGRGGFGVH